MPGSMKKYFTRLVLLMLLSLPSIAEAQVPGILGRKNGLSFQVNLNSSWIEFDVDLRGAKEVSMLPPKIGLAYEVCTGSRKSFELALSYIPLPNSKYTFSDYQTLQDGSTLWEIGEFKVQSNLYTLSTSFRKYFDFSQLGSYRTFGFAGNFGNNTVYPTYGSEVNATGEPTNQQFENFESFVENTLAFSTHIGWGVKWVTPKFRTFDFGCRFWLFMGRRRLVKNEDEYDYEQDQYEFFRQNPKVLVSRLVQLRSQESHLIEVYCSVGIIR